VKDGPRAVGALLQFGEHLGAAQILPERIAIGAASTRPDNAVAADQGNRLRRSEVDAVIEVGEVVRF
jgi:hypothetical protein